MKHIKEIQKGKYTKEYVVGACAEGIKQVGDHLIAMKAFTPKEIKVEVQFMIDTLYKVHKLNKEE